MLGPAVYIQMEEKWSLSPQCEEKRWPETVKPQGLSSVRDVYAHVEGSKDADIVSV